MGEYGYKKAQAQSIFSARPTTAPNQLWIEVCALKRSSNVDLVLLLKSRSRW